MTSLRTDDDAPPPIPDVPYMIGIAPNLGALHAVSHGDAVLAAAAGDRGDHREPVSSACGTPVTIARWWGQFQRGNPYLAGHELCPYCTWSVALDQNAVDAELAALTPSSVKLATMQRLMPDPLLLVKVCAHLLHIAQEKQHYDSEHPIWVRLLGHATAHRPSLLLDEKCGDGHCDHEDDGWDADSEDCYRFATTVACPTCTIWPGSWAGEWAGLSACLVPAPCAVLPAMADHYGVPGVTGAAS